jgi:glycosyltransferase involved in cell wall biosynthesis
VKVAVVSTSYPRHEEDVAGAFVRDGVEALRAEGVEVRVVSPAGFDHLGLAYGPGIPENLRRAPWKGALVPVFLARLALAARHAARDADLVHAHWLPSAFAARTTGRPYVVQLWGTDAELARRLPAVFRPLVAGARLALCASEELAAAAHALGAREAVLVPAGVAIPGEVRAPEEPPHALYVGRLAREKGVLELAEALDGLPLVVVGDGPLRGRLPASATVVGAVPPGEVGSHLERAALVVCPSRREGYGVAARQALAYGRPVVASDVGGLREVVIDGETGVLVPPRDPAALRAAVERLLGDAELRRRLGGAGRALAEERLGLRDAARATIAAYERALGR